MERIAWGAKVSTVFLDRVKWIVEDLEIGVSPADGMSKLMSCMAWESGRTFSPSILNQAGSGATGLIQFMPATAAKLDTTTGKLALMTAENQLNYVWKYFASYKGKLKSLSDLYMAILWPKAIGKPETYVLWAKGAMPTTYRQNSGLDANKDGDIIKAEASAKLNAMLSEGMQDHNSVEYDASAVEYGQVTTVSAIPVHESVQEQAQSVLDKIANIPTKVESIVAPAVENGVQSATAVQETAESITSIAVEPNDKVTAVKHAISGWQGNLAGTVAIASAVALDPSFSSALGNFMASLASGNGRFGALISLIGAGLIGYKAKSYMK